MRIGNNGSDKLGTSSRSSVTHPVNSLIPPVLLATALHDGSLSSCQRNLQLLVQHPLHRRLNDTEITGAHALVETSNTLVTNNLADTVVAVAILAQLNAALSLSNILVQL